MRGGKEVCNGSPLRRYAPALPEGEPLAGRKAQKSPFRSGNSVRGFSFALASTMSTLISYAFIICHSPQKSSAAQKVYSHSSLDIYCIFLPKFMIYLFCGSSPLSYGRGGERFESFTHNFGVCRGKCNFSLHLQVAWQTRQEP